ncbi:MAG: hypothetical protein A3D44_01765 [Candidatus Staskawiczbacteria bacterium RIFCSPHIGHO2_02_FULL_42_22]|uniref:General secretion pathway protein GspM n=1 Tax=Candidatus Staskawiczbacteria bacterium RIFCSPHIGHO2_02_FULL_42_22 TaxID=1802207 RepID=A0A1G2I0P5_9BACT|nr:MAG: hypothetical protein A3D44_01765 [Candidatus Staskawiczbacteria bacterium RIFCSPHIGHO2_02_FULL_42_22]
MKFNRPTLAIMILVITLAFGFLFVAPTYNSIHDLEVTLAQKNQEYTGKAQYYARVFETLSLIKARQLDLQKIDSALPASFSLASLVAFFQDKSNGSGLTLKSTSFSRLAQKSATDKSVAEWIKSISFNLDLSGTYSGFKKFLAALDSSSRLFEVTSISFRSPAGQGVLSAKANQSVIYDFQLQVKTNSY